MDVVEGYLSYTGRLQTIVLLTFVAVFSATQ